MRCGFNYVMVLHPSSSPPGETSSWSATLEPVLQPIAKRRSRIDQPGETTTVATPASTVPVRAVWVQELQRYAACFFLLSSGAEFTLRCECDPKNASPLSAALPSEPAREGTVVLDRKVRTDDGPFKSASHNRTCVSPAFLPVLSLFVSNPAVMAVEGDALLALMPTIRLPPVPFLNSEEDFTRTCFSQAVPARGLTLLVEFVRRLFFEGLFVLPQGDDGVAVLPNSAKRYCIDLSRYFATVDRVAEGGNDGSVAPIAATTACVHWEDFVSDWFTKDKKMRRVLASAADFDIVVDRDFGEAVIATKVYHETLHKGTWITSGFASLLLLMHRLSRRSPPTASSAVGSATWVEWPRLHSVEVRDKKTGALLACTLGFELGRAYHDFSMATLVRDKRVPWGHLATKATAALLVRSNCQLWYWGMKLGYMEAFDVEHHDLGGVNIPRQEFYRRWVAARGGSESSPFIETQSSDPPAAAKGFPPRNTTATMTCARVLQVRRLADVEGVSLNLREQILAAS